ncbi:MAG: NADP-dependent oxidoreductase [Xanthomonadales bacterium]|nr:NADP-dependent oxidoreductase [Xanthomonadales bacterium]MCP5475483.1 NADP-dependent oxidoreductase [Rhodanobacteraceae bacterium]
MKVMQLLRYGGPEPVQPGSAVMPTPGVGQVLVRMHAASINPIDWKQREGMVKDWWPLSMPAILGRDGSGTVVGVGDDQSQFRCGDAVVVLTDSPSNGGSFAEYVVVDAPWVAAKPESMSFVEAAAYPLVGITAWNGLVQTAKVRAGEKVLIQGGAGGVGSMAVQIAKAKGAYVITTASAANRDFVLGLGADEAIDYRSTRFEDAVEGVDLVFDTVGGDTLRRSVAVIRPGGRLVSIAGAISADVCRQAQIECPAEVDAAADAGLSELKVLIDAGQLRVHVDAEFPFAQLAAAMERNREGHTRGKIVVKISPE